MQTLTKSRFTIRLAENTEGPQIAALLSKDWLSAADWDWSEVYPFWLVATADSDIPEPSGDYTVKAGQIIGCVCTIIGKPVGFIEFLAADPDLLPHVQAKVRRLLMIQGCASLKVHGCQFGGGNVPFGAKAFKRAMKKRGARVVWQGNTMLLRLV